ncbi:Beta-glucanase, partial [Cynara cardunculus var. scolymus]
MRQEQEHCLCLVLYMALVRMRMVEPSMHHHLEVYLMLPSLLQHGFGKVNIQIKLVEGDSAGTVTAFYMSSGGPKHHEFDFEFLGNTIGEPYVVQTNVYVNGVGNRVQRLNLWFDHTKDFHSYSILWNQHQVVHQLIWVRANHMIYDYCNDAARFCFGAGGMRTSPPLVRP